MIIKTLILRNAAFAPVIIASICLIIRASFPITAAFFLSKQDYVTAVIIVQFLSIGGLLAGLEFHSVIIRDLSKNINSSHAIQLAVFKNLATALPRTLVGYLIIFIFIFFAVETAVTFLFYFPILFIIVYLDLLLSEAARIKNTCGKFVKGSLLVNFKNVSWLFILPIMLFLNLGIIESIILAYLISFIIIKLLFCDDFKLSYLIVFPKKLFVNLIRFRSMLRPSLLLMCVGWLALINPILERYVLVLIGNYAFAASFFFVGSLVAIAHVFTTNVALIPYHSVFISPNKIIDIKRIWIRLITTSILMVIALGIVYQLVPDKYFPEGIEKEWYIFGPMLISSQIIVAGSFFSIRLYAAKADLILFLISTLEIILRVTMIFCLSIVERFDLIPMAMMLLIFLMYLVRHYFYRKANID